jgi:hypothetical protein
VASKVVHLPIALASEVLGLLTEADSKEVFADCIGRMDPTGKFCTVCAAVEQLQLAIWAAQDEEKKDD